MKQVAGYICLVLAVGLLGLVVIAILDPAGAKLADDGDPFGPPPPWYVDAVLLAVGAGLAWIGAHLAFARQR